MQLDQIIISACVTTFSLGLLIVSVTSYRKHKNQKLLFVSAVFFLLLIKGISLSIGLFVEDVLIWLYPLYSSLFDVFILLLLFVATLKR
ncbi:MAG: hypothetical protein QXL17_07915 [Candidatus Thermoplasmatota archaeon]